MEQGKLSVGVKMGYGVCDLGGNLFFTAVGLWLMNYLTDTVGIAAGLAGVIIALGKIWDAVTDPVAGYLSDRTKTRWGRRRPWLLFGSFPLFIATIIMFTNPQLDTQAALFVWGLLAFMLLNTTYTAVNIPYNSLTPELTRDFHERTALNGYRFAFAVIGTIVAAGAALPIVKLFPDRNIGFSAMGTIFGGVMLITALITFFSVREPERKDVEVTGNFIKTYLKVFRNKPYLLILATYTLHITALTVIMSVAIYYFKYIHHSEDATTVAMVLLLVTAMVTIPLSVVISKRLGKKLVYGSGMAILGGMLVVVFFIGHLSLFGIEAVNLATYMMVPAGIGLGLTYAMPYAMVPDAVEYDYLVTGERTEGAFYGVWTFGIKIGQAIALAITGGVLSLVGYVPEVAQSALSQFGIRLLLGPISAFIFLLAIVALRFYPINEKRYNEILDDIEKMEAEKA